ncbi:MULTISPECIES: hypothetical protein [unclassified Bacillus (in: firmicutes)]|uniref:hypothetical protein n=1 Tax=unclassified Bacillus (in: firmicutes) TaxID=185979 RepID=UPI0008ED7E95|nr:MULTISPECIES: hypothetical protein [unclassified Bacillus (in: firmicutes)]SFA77030.1 hypothetical protein SAMN02799634_101639 [Bacillus sp. UNCCL13]SFQ66921.1 hypothetical protein SAMN04488577_0916 [Bacillus sp. cl95]
MKNIFKLMVLTSMLTLFLAGCGSNEEKANQTNGSGNTGNEEKQSEENNDNEKADDKQEKVPEGDVVRILEQNLTYTVNGEQKEDTAFLKYNDQQNYSMYVLPEYELTSEEPGKEILFFKTDDSVFMRIELLPAETEWTTVKDTTKSQLQAVSSEVTTPALPDDDFFKDATVMETSTESETVTAYLIDHGDMKMKLTLFSKKDADHRSPFIEMAKTILKGKSE